MNLKMDALLVGSMCFLAGCSPPPEYIERCLESHTEEKMVAVPKIVAPGRPSIGRIAFVRRTRTVCDKIETIRNPKYDRWLQKQTKAPLEPPSD